MRFVRAIRQQGLQRPLGELRELYAKGDDPEFVSSIQLSRFNELWKQTVRQSPYYRALAGELSLPEEFRCWEEFSSSIPLINREKLRREIPNLTLTGRRADYFRITGGTTSEPLRLPAWRSEDRITARNTWFARSWFDACAADRLFLLWGHSHLLGDGLSGRLNAVRRRLKDECVGYLRSSAYDLSEEGLRTAGERILAFRPGYLLGYATALYRLAIFNAKRQEQFRQLGLKVIIATGESFPSPNSAQLISRVFGCPVVMEYGAVETGTIAHQRPSGEFQVFWGSYFVEGIPSPDYPDAREIAVTALYPRLTPLIRYRIGDLISGTRNPAGGYDKFDNIIGRANDGIVIGASGFVHSEAFTHVMRDIDRIHGFQVVQAPNREITINYTSDTNLPSDTTRLIRARLSRIDERLGAVHIARVTEIDATVAGKSKRIVSFVDSAGDHAA